MIGAIAAISAAGRVASEAMQEDAKTGVNCSSAAAAAPKRKARSSCRRAIQRSTPRIGRPETRKTLSSTSGGGGRILPAGASRKTTEKRILGIFSLHERSFHCSLEISAFCFQSVSHEKESRVCGRLSGSACQSCKHAVVNNKSVRKHLLQRFEAHSTLFGTSLCHEMDLTSLVGSNFDYCIL